VRLNPVLTDLALYPFVRLQEARAAVEARGVEIIDFGVGEPREETPAFIRRAVAAAVDAEPVSGYPAAVGLPQLRVAIAAWVGRRFGAALDPETEVVPTFGTKEAIFSLAQVVGAPGDAVAFTVPGYPVPERGARFAGQEPVALELREERGWLPDLDAVPWARLSLLWLNTPNNPTGAVAPLEFLQEAAERCRAAGAVLASDEAYSELWFAGEPPGSALQLAERRGVLAFNTLSKRSSMPGYRSGFVAGDPEIIAALKRFRPNTGTAPQTFVQRAAVAAWGDEDHVDATREHYRLKREIVLPALVQAGLRAAGGPASFFLWMAVDGGDDEAFAAGLLERHGIVVAPGAYLGAPGYVRVALVPTLEECRRAAALVTDARAGSR
jgi:aspartate/methionine/tyrosine aminotransferase